VERIERSAFITWVAKVGLLPSTNSPEQELGFEGPGEFHKFWSTPPSASELPGFVSMLMTATAPNGPFVLSLRGGANWFTGAEYGKSPLQDQLRDRILGTLPIPRDFNGALRFEEAEWRDAMMIILTMLVYGWRVSDDVEVIGPGRAAAFVTSHHGYVIVRCASAQRLTDFEQTMTAARLPPAPDQLFSRR
jgi:hypothetical protein